MIGIAVSKNGVPIRLTEERWFRMWRSHGVPSRSDAHIVTAFLTKKVDKVLRRGIVWQKK